MLAKQANPMFFKPKTDCDITNMSFSASPHALTHVSMITLYEHVRHPLLFYFTSGVKDAVVTSLDPGLLSTSSKTLDTLKWTDCISVVSHWPWKVSHCLICCNCLQLYTVFRPQIYNDWTAMWLSAAMQGTIQSCMIISWAAYRLCLNAEVNECSFYCCS